MVTYASLKWPLVSPWSLYGDLSLSVVVLSPNVGNVAGVQPFPGKKRYPQGLTTYSIPSISRARLCKKYYFPGKGCTPATLPTLTNTCSYPERPSA
jgi:hypothetical protein